jgi:hypothetical protein
MNVAAFQAGLFDDGFGFESLLGTSKNHKTA